MFKVLLINEVRNAAGWVWCLPTSQSQELAYDSVDPRTGLAAYLREVVGAATFNEYEFDVFWKFIRDKTGLWFMLAIDAFINGMHRANFDG